MGEFDNYFPIPPEETSAPDLTTCQLYMPFDKFAMASATHSVPTAGFRPPFSPQHNLTIPEDSSFSFMFDGPFPVPYQPQALFSIRDGYAAPEAGIPNHGEDYIIHGWGENTCAAPQMFFEFPSNASHNTNILQRVAHQAPDAFYPQPNSYHRDGFYDRMAQPFLPELIPHDAQTSTAVPPITANSSESSCFLQDPFMFEFPSPSSSPPVSSPESFASSSTSSLDSLSHKRQRVNPMDATLQTRVFECLWEGCHEKITYVPISDEGGLPEVVRLHLHRHFPVTQKQTNVPCGWESCNKFTARDNLRKHILKHLPAFNYHCPGCDASYQRPEKWHDHAGKCKKYHAHLSSHGRALPIKRVKQTRTTQN